MTTVAISGLHRGENPQPGAAVAASLRRSFPDLRIVGLCYDPLESALYSHDESCPDAAYLLPFPGVGPEALLERLDEILAQEPIDAVIPCLDSEIANYIDLQPELAERGVHCLPPSRQALERRSKTRLTALCRALDIPTPRTELAHHPAALFALAEEIGYPLYVKGRFYEARRATSYEDVIEAYDEIVRVWGGPVLLQEVVIGEEYNVVGLGDGAGGLLGSCAIRKMQRTAAGKGFAGVVVANPELDARVRETIAELRWDGPFELEFIKAPHAPLALFEMNPRFPAWVDFPSQIGCNLPARLLERLLDLAPAALRRCTAGQMFIRHSVDLVTDISEIAHMTTSGQRVEEPVGTAANLRAV